MESSVATHREDVAPARDGPILLAPQWPASKGRQRGSILARMLLGADVLAAVNAALLGGWIVGLEPDEFVIFITGATIAWPLTAFAVGLYNDGGRLRFWVSGVSEVPQGLTAIVLFSWPLFMIATASGASAAGAAALWTVLLTAVLSPLARASVRTKLTPRGATPATSGDRGLRGCGGSARREDADPGPVRHPADRSRRRRAVRDRHAGPRAPRRSRGPRARDPRARRGTAL